MSIALEPVNTLPAIEEVPLTTQENVEPEQGLAAEPVEAVEVDPPSASTEPLETAALEPTPKRRGRPPKTDAAPKAKAPPKEKAPPKPKAPPKATKAKAPKPPPPEDSSSEDVDETLQNVYNHVARPDLETAVLQFLVNRRQNEAQRRRTLWSQMAQM